MRIFLILKLSLLLILIPLLVTSHNSYVSIYSQDDTDVDIDSLGRKCTLSLYLLYLAFSGSQKIDKEFNKHVSITLKTIYLEDPAFPSLTPEQLERAMEFVRKAVALEFNFTGVSFAPMEVEDLDQYFEKVIGKKKVIGTPVNLFQPEFPQLTLKQRNFFKNYSLDDLGSFVHGKKIDSLEQFYEHLCAAWFLRMERFRSLEMNSKKVFTPDRLLSRTYTGWKTLLYYQTEFDFFITNTLVFYDDLERPSPHIIFNKGKTGGMSDKSPGAPNCKKTAIMASVIGFSGVPYFSEENVPKERIPEVLGIYLIAHELGHMLFKLPDVYNHPLHCLMNSPPENMNYMITVERFHKHQGPCPACRRWLTASKFRWIREVVKKKELKPGGI